MYSRPVVQLVVLLYSKIRFLVLYNCQIFVITKLYHFSEVIEKSSISLPK